MFVRESAFGIPHLGHACSKALSDTVARKAENTVQHGVLINTVFEAVSRFWQCSLMAYHTALPV
jgi:hypothetical protein